MGLLDPRHELVVDVLGAHCKHVVRERLFIDWNIFSNDRSVHITGDIDV